MIEFVIASVAVVLGLAGLAGCILPVLPGPPLSYLGMLLLYAAPYLGTGATASSLPDGRFMLIWLAITVIATVLDYFVPVWFTRVTGGSKAAVRGSLAGMLAGLVFFPPFGMIPGAFLGAWIAEQVWGGKSASGSLGAAFGSFLGFLFGTGLKLAASGMMMFYIVKFIFLI